MLMSGHGKSVQALRGRLPTAGRGVRPGSVPALCSARDAAGEAAGDDREAIAADLDGGRRDRPRTAEADEKPEDPKQPLPFDPDTFWKGAVRLPEEVMGDVTPPPISCALPRRLGPFPFWQGQKPLLDALEPIYKKASQHAVGFLLGEPSP